MASTGETICNNGQSAVSVTRRRSYQVVIAATRDMGLGMDMKLPWDLPSEYQFFQDVTTRTSDPTKRNATIMGRKSWESTPLEIRPLPGRLNIVLTKSSCHNIAIDENVLVSSSMESALELLATEPYSLSIEKVFVIGGGELLRNYMNASICDAIHLTEIDISVPCDAFAPRVDTSLYRPWYSSFPVVENGIRYSFNTYVRRKDAIVGSGEKKSVAESDLKEYSFLPKMVFERHEEFGYLNLVQNIISSGDMNDNSTLSKFGCQMRFNLRKTFPLLTTKKIFWLGVVEEILQLISGSNNPKENGSHIWDTDEAKEYLDSFGVNATEEDGDNPFLHGLHWKHCDASQEFSQLSDVINKIKNNPHDQRIMLAACNPLDFKLSVSPCHTFTQFYVANGEVSCQIYQSSTEASIGIPFSIATYSLLTCIIAHVCDLGAGDFIHVIGQAYINKAHVKAIQKQLQISPKPFPILKINPEKKKMDNFEASDLELMRI
ncbi:Bifunctional dihydrofolate reductase/thymidylate synthase [Arabidopsis thaliana]|jgi:dihydrofolate reductase/thymidylate synthase|uniref:Bifunctional dihydrofolate reductase-thymidylate synthase n=1 Tax=Arabidopsis thaliana TaxID=3702 RepID=A0A1P8B0G7_ARATH|nr:Bifunctional dihydrofolate reductase/thymidylate synthase [Arabidopsis thaliana]ANM62397.1 Bifunctional dihydrofolate reductase/thymidylate synthase [Arabidopsis thaliana]|eukprot:NP_001324557.1 Bifunctional dihydrofolate reductase/thymidylate synthase [Arabidopsis thaliana]